MSKGRYMNNLVRVLGLMTLLMVMSLVSSAATLLCSAGSTTTKTGNSTYQTVYTYSTPAGSIPINEGIRVTSYVVTSSNNPLPTARVTLNGIVVLTGNAKGSSIIGA